MKTDLDLTRSEAHARLYFGVNIDSSLFVTLPPAGIGTRRRDQEQLEQGFEAPNDTATATNADRPATDIGLGASMEAYRVARMQRSQMLRAMCVAAVRAIHATLREGYARLREAISRESTVSRTGRAGSPTRRSLRARVTAAFGKIAHGVDERTAHRKTREFYRSSGAAWTRQLV